MFILIAKPNWLKPFILEYFTFQYVIGEDAPHYSILTTERLLPHYFGLEYLHILIFIMLATLLCLLLIVLAYVFSIGRIKDSEKLSEYECGFEPFDSATRLPFDVHFYVVGILFLIFDVEIAVLFPWIVALETTAWVGYISGMIFLVILAVGFVFEWRRGALLWPHKFVRVL